MQPAGRFINPDSIPNPVQSTDDDEVDSQHASTTSILLSCTGPTCAQITSDEASRVMMTVASGVGLLGASGAVGFLCFVWNHLWRDFAMARMELWRKRCNRKLRNADCKQTGRDSQQTPRWMTPYSLDSFEPSVSRTLPLKGTYRVIMKAN